MNSRALSTGALYETEVITRASWTSRADPGSGSVRAQFSSVMAHALTAFDESGEPDLEAYRKRLSEKFGVRVTIESVAKDQKSLDAVGGRMSGRDVIIAPNIFREMATDEKKAAYYEGKIQYFFDSIPRWTAESAARGLTFEPCGVVIHEDGTVTYICGGEDSPERKAKVAAENALKRKKRAERIRLAEEASLRGVEAARLLEKTATIHRIELSQLFH